MKKKGKRILSLIISSCMLLSNIPTTVFAENLQLDEIEIIEEIPEAKLSVLEKQRLQLLQEPIKRHVR